jgi:hypothetical protein
MPKQSQVSQYVVVPLSEVGSWKASNYRPNALVVVMPSELAQLTDEMQASLAISSDSSLQDCSNAVLFVLCRLGNKPVGASGQEMFFTREDQTLSALT